MIKPIKPKSRAANLVIQEMPDETLIYDSLIGKALCLNKTSALVWQACDGTKDIAEIAADLSEKLGYTVSAQLIRLTLDVLKQANLLENAEELVINFENRVSRREAIRNIGLTSIIALPAISSLIAPTAAHAGSNSCIGSIPCTTAGDCVSFGAGASCSNNCCSEVIPGTICIPSPTNICPPAPPGCDPVFGC